MSPMPYYDTIEEDLARAKEILAKGRAAAEPDLPPALRGWLEAHGGGTIYGADTYAAYKLLESFVAEIERLRHDYADAERRAGSILEQCEDQQDRLDEAGREIERLQREALTRDNEKRGQFIALMEIRQLCDQATGIDRSQGDARESGALGAVKALIGRYTELVEAVRDVK